MKALFGGMIVRLSGAGALLLVCAPALAQQAAGAPPPPVPPITVHHSTHHTAHHRRTHRGRLNQDQAASIAPQPQPSGAAHPGTEPAPVPNEDIGPPNHNLPSEGEVSPGSMAIHYPPTGEGYLPGSSSSDMDNRTTPSVPGVQYQTPIANPAPQPLPAPGSGDMPKP